MKEEKEETRKCLERHTFLPALLLCKFIKLLSSPSNSLASRNFRANRMPKPTSTLQPPHFQPDGEGSLGLGPGAQPQAVIFPRAQAAVMAYVTPALEIAYVNAASLEPATTKPKIISSINGRKVSK